MVSDVNLHPYNKPPLHCEWSRCDDDQDSAACEQVPQREMPWFDVEEGALPAFTCDDPGLAAFVSVQARSKPFCMRPGAYASGDLASCWPTVAEARADKEGASCAGEHAAVLMGAGGNTAVAAEDGAVADDARTIRVDPARQRCERAASSSGGGGVSEGRELLFAFEEGPCGGDSDTKSSCDAVRAVQVDIRLTLG